MFIHKYVQLLKQTVKLDDNVHIFLAIEIYSEKPPNQSTNKQRPYKRYWHPVKLVASIWVRILAYPIIFHKDGGGIVWSIVNSLWIPLKWKFIALFWTKLPVYFKTSNINLFILWILRLIFKFWWVNLWFKWREIRVSI
jgi:hypothetical protein